MIPKVDFYFSDTALCLTRSTSNSTGYDLPANESCTISPGEFRIVRTGLFFTEVPRDLDIQIRSRSGLAAKRGVFVLNGVGTVDPDYRGEVCAILFNAGKEDFSISKGDRIAQIVFAKSVHPVFLNDAKKNNSLERGTGGFGSTGI